MGVAVGSQLGEMQQLQLRLAYSFSVPALSNLLDGICPVAYLVPFSLFFFFKISLFFVFSHHIKVHVLLLLLLQLVLKYPITQDPDTYTPTCALRTYMSNSY